MKQEIIYDFFDKIDTEEKAYWLGFLFADGNVTKRGDVLNVNLQIKDKDHLQKLASVFNKSLKTARDACRGKIFMKSVLRVCSTYLCRSLIAKGIVPRKTYIDSDVFCHVPKNLIRHFIRGNMDGDGCICRFIGYGKIRFRVDFLGRSKFIHELKEILEKQFPDDPFYATSYQSLWRLCICFNPRVYKVLSWLYDNSNIHLERKHKKYLSLKNDIEKAVA